MPEISRFGTAQAGTNTSPAGVSWYDINTADPADYQWLMAWPDISEPTRTALLEPVRFSHYEQVSEGTLLTLKMLRSDETDDPDDLGDLKLLIGPTTAITLRSGTVAAVEQLHQSLPTNKSLVTAVDLLGFLVTAMTNRMEPFIAGLTQDIDDVEDAMLDSGLFPAQQTLSEFERRIVRTKRHVNYTQQVLDPMTTDPTLAMDADDRETLVRAYKHVTRYLQRLDECRTRVQTLGQQIEAQRSEIMTRSSLNLSIVATVFLPLSFITGLLGMNVAGIPDQHNPYGFWLVTGMSIILSLLAWLMLRRQTFGRYPDQIRTGDKRAAGLAQTTPATAAGVKSAPDQKPAGHNTQGTRPAVTQSSTRRPEGK